MRTPVAAGSGSQVRGSDEWIERVRAQSDLVEIIGQTVSLKRVGRNWVGLCPFHQERTPSFAVHPERQFYHCFSCKAGGDVFKFIQETEKLGFVESAEWLSRRAGIPIPERRAGERGQRTLLFEALEAATQAYEQWLGDPGRGAEVRAYCTSRGLSHEVMRQFRLGLAPAGWENLVQRLRGRHRDEVLVEAGLAIRREGSRSGLYDRFRHRLMIPLVGPGGQVAGFGARALEAGDEPKYLNSPETPVYHKGAFLFGLDLARRQAAEEGEIIVVEGYFDAISLHQAGVRNVVATSGTALTLEQARLLKRSVGRVVLAYDGDTAGQEAMLRSFGVLLAEGLEVVVVALSSGEDPDRLVREGGIEAWREGRRSSIDPIEFIHRRGQKPNGAAAEQREHTLQTVVALAAAISDPVRLRLLLERAGQVLGFSEAILGRAVALRRSGQRSEPPIRAAVREQSLRESHAERELLQSLLQSPDELEQARRTVSPEDFRDPQCAALARRLWMGEGLAAEDETAALARELTAEATDGIDWKQVAEGGLRALTRRRLERRFKVTQQRIQELQQQGLVADPETVRLLHESQTLARRISELNR